MLYEFSDDPLIEAGAKILDRLCLAIQILAVSILAGLVVWHTCAAVLA